MIYKSTLRKLIVNNTAKAIYTPDDPLTLDTEQLYADAVSVCFNIVVNDIGDDLFERVLASNLKEVTNVFKSLDSNIITYKFKVTKEVKVGDEVMLLFETYSTIPGTMDIELEGYFDFNIAALDVDSKYTKYIVKATVEEISETDEITLTFTSTEETAHIGVRNLVILEGNLDILHVDSVKHDTLLEALPELCRMESDFILLPGIYCTENVFLFNVGSKMPFPIKVQRKSRADSSIYTSKLLPGDTAVITDNGYLLRGEEKLEATNQFRSADIYYLEDILKYREATIRMQFKVNEFGDGITHLLSKAVDNNIILKKNLLFVDSDHCLQSFNGCQFTTNNVPITEGEVITAILAYSVENKTMVLKVGSVQYTLQYVDNAFGDTRENKIPWGDNFNPEDTEKGTTVSDKVSCKEVISVSKIAFLTSMLKMTYNSDVDVWVMKYWDTTILKNYTDYTFSFYVTISKVPEIGIDFDIVSFGVVYNENITITRCDLLPNTYKVVSVTNTRNSTNNHMGIKRTPLQSNIPISVGGFKLEEGNYCTPFINSSIDNSEEKLFIGGGSGMKSLEILSLSVIPRFLSDSELNEL